MGRRGHSILFLLLYSGCMIPSKTRYFKTFRILFLSFLSARCYLFNHIWPPWIRAECFYGESGMFSPCNTPIYTSSPLSAASGNLSFGARESGGVGLKITQHWSHLCKMERRVDQPLMSSQVYLWVPLWSMILTAVMSLLTNKLKEIECMPILWPIVSKFSVNLCFFVTSKSCFQVSFSFMIRSESLGL